MSASGAQQIEVAAADVRVLPATNTAASPQLLRQRSGILALLSSLASFGILVYLAVRIDGSVAAPLPSCEASKVTAILNIGSLISNLGMGLCVIQVPNEATYNIASGHTPTFGYQCSAEEFSHFDLNGDGVISATEFSIRFRSRGDPADVAFRETFLQNTINEIGNRDNVIDFEEFCSMGESSMYETEVDGERPFLQQLITWYLS